MKDTLPSFLKGGPGTWQDYLNVPGSELGACRGWSLAVIRGSLVLMSWQKWIDKEETELNWVSPQGETTSNEFGESFSWPSLDRIQPPSLSYWSAFMTQSYAVFPPCDTEMFVYWPLKETLETFLGMGGTRSECVIFVFRNSMLQGQKERVAIQLMCFGLHSKGIVNIWVLIKDSFY